LEKPELKLYTLIWKRTLASQMADAIFEVTKYSFSPKNYASSEWEVAGEVIKFDGFMKLYIESSDEEGEEEDISMLPKVDIGEVLASNYTQAKQTFSRPPARYTEASLVKKLESEGIGRPSTYAPTISTIIDRGYVEKADKKYLAPTDIAFTVNDFLQEYFTEMMDYKFTRDVEEDFDKIAKGEETYKQMLENFWQKTLKKDIENA
jgi:DNA topoisomerase-1